MHRPTNSVILQPPSIHDAPTYEILAKSNRVNCNLNTSNLVDVCHVGFDRKWTLTILQLPGTDNAPTCQISTVRQHMVELLMI